MNKILRMINTFDLFIIQSDSVAWNVPVESHATFMLFLGPIMIILDKNS